MFSKVKRNVFLWLEPPKYSSLSLYLHSSMSTNFCLRLISKSTNIILILFQGEHDINDEVFLSLPCVLGRSGVCDVIRQPLTQTERSQLHQSADLMAKVQAGIKF